MIRSLVLTTTKMSLLAPALFGPITVTSFWYSLLLRGPIALLIFFIEPFAAVMFDAVGENIDFILAVCIDGANELQYSKFDKIFDFQMIVIIWIFMWIVYNNTKNDPQARQVWFWIPPLLFLAPYRVIGMILFMITSERWFLVIFPNVWLLYFFVFSALHWIGWSQSLRRRRRLFWFVVILIAAWKFVEEYLHHISQFGSDLFEDQCARYDTPVTHADAMWIFLKITSYLLILIFTWAIVMANRRWKHYRKNKKSQTV